MRFEKFANMVEDKVASATFFVGCVLLVVIWAPSYFIFGSIDTWQLVINTITTIVTFLLVSLLQTTQRQHELDSDKKNEELCKKLDLVIEMLERRKT